MNIKRIELESNNAGSNQAAPYMDLYLLASEYDGEAAPFEKRPLVLVCPGGGYTFLSDREAEPIALQYLSHGYNVGVVYYTVNAPHPQPILDLGRAICHVRENAKEYHVDTDKIAVCGFSAGGHLAGTLCTMWHEPALAKALGVSSEMLKPNLGLLCYPVITSGEYAHVGSFDVLAGEDTKVRTNLALENHVSDKIPPTYLWHTCMDTCVPVMNSLMYAQKLSENHVPFELHIYPKCDHGMSLATKETAVGYSDMIDSYIGSWVSETYRFMEYMFEEK